MRPIDDGLVYHVINRGNNCQPVFCDESDYAAFIQVEHAGDYRWSSFACHGNGCADPLLDPTPAYEALGIRPATRQRRCSAYVHQTPDADELAAIRRSSETGLP